MRNAAVRFEPINPSQYPAVREFLMSVGWSERVNELGKFQQLMERADRTVVVWEDEKVVGFGRALTDDVSNGYISMLAVAHGWRGKGIGSEIVRQLIGENREITWVLRAGRESSQFWAKQGFTKSDIAMERTREGTG